MIVNFSDDRTDEILLSDVRNIRCKGPTPIEELKCTKYCRKDDEYKIGLCKLNSVGEWRCRCYL